MKKSFKNLILLAWGVFVLLLSGMLSNVKAQDFLAPDLAFKLKTQASHRTSGVPAVRVQLTVAGGYYLYQESLKIKSLTPDVQVEYAPLPSAKQKFDEAFGKDVFYYRDQLDLIANISAKSPLHHPIKIEIKYQGCADAGLCYPPITQVVELMIPVLDTTKKITTKLPDAIKKTPVQDSSVAKVFSASMAKNLVEQPQVTSASNTNESSSSALVVVGQINQQQNGVIESLLKGGSFALIVAVFFVIGLLLAFTPCVLPMIPILVGYLLGQHRGTIKGGLISVAYSTGVILIYTLFGVLAGLTGKNLSLWLQKPAFLIFFTVLLLVLALSMFGLFHLKLPHKLENRLSKMYDKQPKFRLFGAFVMGCLSALMVGPCITPALLGVLLHMAQTQDVVLGASALAAMGLGMCVPLLVLGALSSQLTPFFRKLNQLSFWFKGLFGVLLLLLAFWTIVPVLPSAVVPKTLAQWRGLQVAHASLPFKQIKSLDELKTELAKYRGQPVMLDFYATWCTACIEMENKTFSDPSVKAALRDVVLLQIDVTQHSELDRQIYQYINIFGPPMIIWFDSQSEELKALRVAGFMDAKRFLTQVEAYQKTFHATQVPRLARSF